MFSRFSWLRGRRSSERSEGPASAVPTSDRAAARTLRDPSFSDNRVTNAVQLVEALRRVEAELATGGGDGGGTARRVRRGLSLHSMHLFAALAMRELDELIDAMTYEELLEAFGDHRSAAAGLGEAHIASIPERQISALEAKRLSAEGAACSVCLDPFCAGQTMRELACDHAFHSECIDRWLRKSTSCPVCRRCCRGAED